MTAHSSTTPSGQLTLDFLPGLAELHGSALACVDAQIKSSGKPLKTIAADMDLSSSELSRKLANNPNDTRHFTLNDLEAYVKATGNTTPILYLVQKYCVDTEVKQRQALAALALQVPSLIALLKAAGVQA
jgi:hypothetical protein